MPDSPGIAYIYLASKKLTLGNVPLGATNLRALVNAENTRLSDYPGGAPFQYRVVTKPPVPDILKLSWPDESSFRHLDVAHCLIDGRCYDEFKSEIYTIRAHHFPGGPKYPKFSVIYPGEMCPSADNDEAACSTIESEHFRCSVKLASASALELVFIVFETAHQKTNDLTSMIT